MSPLVFPEDIAWAEELVASKMKVAAFLAPQKGSVAPQGGTRAWGLPDIPVGATWALPPTGVKHWNRLPWALNQSPYDGESFYLQLNLAEIPAAVRKPEWPAVGVVWVLIDLSQESGWEADAYFDPRPAEQIVWHPRLDERPPEAAQWTLANLAPDCTESVLPEICWAAETYDEWAQEHNARARKSDIQVGGWVWPCQGWFDERNPDFVCALERQSFGDSGAIYLHYNLERGFYALVETH